MVFWEFKPAGKQAKASTSQSSFRQYQGSFPPPISQRNQLPWNLLQPKSTTKLGYCIRTPQNIQHGFIKCPHCFTHTHIDLRPSQTPLLPTIYPNVSPSEISLAFSRIFENRLSSTQLAAFLTLLHSTGLDRSPAVIASCASAMRDAALPIDRPTLRSIVRKRKRTLTQGTYRGGLCDIVGTGGDSHSTFNISTTSSIIASPLLLIAKHGNRAQTSKSGSADVLNAITPTAPNLEAVTAASLPTMYDSTNYAFLFAPNFHSGMRHAATVRRELGLRTIFNIMGPLANPVEWALEARLVGVATKELGPPYAEALRLSGARKALVVCGQEGLDEISCAGPTDVWMLREVRNPAYVERKNEAAEANYNQNEDDEDEDNTSDDDAPPRYTSELSTFTLHPSDFGLPVHPLSEVGGGQGPDENARILMQILRNELPCDHPILHFVLMNVAALLVVSGVCEAEGEEEVIEERGPGGGKWKEGVRRARWCLESGRAGEELEGFVLATRKGGVEGGIERDWIDLGNRRGRFWWDMC